MPQPRSPAIAHLLLIALAIGSCHAAPKAERLEQLGKTLTPWGAEIAGNDDGRIPAYTGGIDKPPVGWTPDNGRWPDPFAADKPIYSVNAENAASHAQRLTPGTMEMLRRWPASFRVDVYPTRRSVPAMEGEAARAAIRNAGDANCRTVSNGVGIEGCTRSTPFPLPSDGYQIMWNHLLRQRPPASTTRAASYVFDANGRQQAPMEYLGTYDNPYWAPTKPDASDRDEPYYSRSQIVTQDPARDAGNANIVFYPLRPDRNDQRTWTYTTGQRRVRLAPEFAYDTPIAQLGGVVFFDEANAFAGRMDRFDFKLIGKQEMIVPYNLFKAVWTPPAEAFGPHHVRPEVMRWELHRVWVVEATLKPGFRHAASKRRFYVDEDSWAILMTEGYDQGNRLFRVILGHTAPNYGVGGGINDFNSSLQAYDLSRGLYCVVAHYGIPRGSFKAVQRTPAFASSLGPASLAGSGVR